MAHRFREVPLRVVMMEYRIAGVFIKVIMQHLEKYLSLYKDRANSCEDIISEKELKELETLAEIECIYNIVIRNPDYDVNGAFVNAQRLITFLRNYVKYEFK
jgi:hypothetical protein